MRQAVIVIDMINDFVTGKSSFQGALDIVPNIKNLIVQARAKEVMVVYVCDAHSPKDPEMQVWGEHAMAGTDGSQVIHELRLDGGELVLPKHTYDFFFDTELDELLKKNDVEEIVLVGVVTDICIQNSAAGAFFRGYKMVVPEDCVAAADKKAHQYALDYMRKMYGVKVTNSSEVIVGW